MGCGISSFDTNSKIISQNKNGNGTVQNDFVSSNKYAEDEDDTKISYSSHITSPSLNIGSPSFRDYVVRDNLVIDNINGKKGCEKMENNMASIDVSSRSNVGSEIEKTRVQRFKKVFPIHRPSAVRNFMNASSCYNNNNNVSARVESK